MRITFYNPCKFVDNPFLGEKHIAKPILLCSLLAERDKMKEKNGLDFWEGRTGRSDGIIYSVAPFFYMRQGLTSHLELLRSFSGSFKMNKL